ncbi:Cryptococcal mannosyltransferase 1 domain containing protein [Naviculisporaceae sp. PSN 640]
MAMDTRDHEEAWDSEEEKWNLLNRKTTPKRRWRIITTWISSRLRIPRLLERKRRRYCSPTCRVSCPRPSRRALKICFVVFFPPLFLITLMLLTPFYGPSYAHLPEHYQDLAKRCFPVHPVPGCANPLKENIFIAATIRDPTGDLVSGKWGQNVLSLITILGQENVFISIYENNSGPKGREALETFKTKIHSRHRVVIEDDDKETPFKGGNVTLPDGSQRVKYYAYQAELRNRVLRPLDTFNKRLGGLGGQIDIIFDKVLFLDDVAFNPIDAAHLLFNTNLQPSPGKKDDPKKAKADYLLACALSYSSPLQLSPSSASTIRDTKGYAPSRLFFPFFSSSNSPASSTRSSISSFSEAIPVNSCWGGMVAIKATYVQNLSPETDTYQPVQNHLLNPASPLREPPKDDEPRSPVRFRYEPSEYYEASTGCLFSADLAYSSSLLTSGNINTNPKTDGERDDSNNQIFLNPYVRVGTSEQVLNWLFIIQKYERLFIPMSNLIQALTSPWVRRNNPYREIQAGKTFEEEIWDVNDKKWTVADKPARLGRPGMFCGWRGMRVLDSHYQDAENGKEKNGRKWVDLKVPPGYRTQSDTGSGQLEEKEKLGGAWKDDFERLGRDIAAGRKSEEDREKFWEV